MSSIEFNCTECQSLLRVPVETAGRQTECPKCRETMSIPSLEFSGLPSNGSSPPSAEASEAFPDAQESSSAENPYQSPREVSPTESAYPSDEVYEQRVLRYTVVSVNDVVARTWEIFKARKGKTIDFVVGAYFLLVGVVWAVVFIASNISFSLESLFKNPLAYLPLAAILLVVGLFAAWLGAGLMGSLLAISRGEEAKFDQLFSGGKYLLRLLGVTVFAFFGLALITVGSAGLAIGAVATFVSNPFDVPFFELFGQMLISVPLGFYFLLAISLSPFLIVDRNMGVTESLVISFDITRRNKISIFAIGLIATFFVAIGLALIVGVFVALPFACLLMSVTYLAITGQYGGTGTKVRRTPKVSVIGRDLGEKRP